MKKNIDQTVRFELGIEPQDLGDGSANGAIVDSFGYSEIAFVLVVGALGGTAPTLDVKIQNGADSGGSDMADVTDAAFTQVTATNDQAVYVGVIRQADFGSRYYRAVSTIGGTGPTGEYSVVTVLGGAKNLAVSQVTSLGFELNNPA